MMFTKTKRRDRGCNISSRLAIGEYRKKPDGCKKMQKIVSSLSARRISRERSTKIPQAQYSKQYSCELCRFGIKFIFGALACAPSFSAWQFSPHCLART